MSFSSHEQSLASMTAGGVWDGAVEEQSRRLAKERENLRIMRRDRPAEA